jgi:putative salt-induced outer membrane protein
MSPCVKLSLNEENPPTAGKSILRLALPRICGFYPTPLHQIMKKTRHLMMAVGMMAAFLTAASAQTSTDVYTATNVVTVLVTNVVTVTNIVEAKSAPEPEAKPAEVEKIPKYPWESSVSLGLTLTRGNSHTLLYSGTYQTEKKTPENEYKLGISGAYGSQNSQENVNNYGGYGQWNHLFSDRFYGYARVDVLRDIIADIDYRVNIGPGVGYYLIKSASTTFSVEAGAGETFERLGETSLVGTNYVHSYENQSFATIRFADNFEHKFNDRARIWQKCEVLPQIDKLQNYVVNFEIGVEASIVKSLALKTYLDDMYQSEPAAGRYRNDVKLVSALSYKF